MSAFSLYIPSVYANITASMISETFHRMNVGRVKHVELVSKNTSNGPRQNKAYVFFDSLYQSDFALEIHNNVMNNVTAKLPYGRSEHVFWILLNSKRQYDGSSNNGEYVEPNFTEEEIAFMEEEIDRQNREENDRQNREENDRQNREENDRQECNNDINITMVSLDYAINLEQEISNLRNMNAQLHASYIDVINHNQYLCDKLNKWTELGMNEQGTRLCNLIQCENQREEAVAVE